MSAAHDFVEIRTLGACVRLAVRAAPEHVALVSRALGADLPPRIGGLTESDSIVAICLGPDEWQVIGAEGVLSQARQAAASLSAPCSIVDVSARDVAMEVRGAGAVALLNSGCPADLGNMPERSAARTVFDGAQVVLIKWTADRFVAQVWRSFANHVWAVLDQASGALRSE